MTVLLGNGSGGFTAARAARSRWDELLISLAVGDFNGDGIQDLAIGKLQRQQRNGAAGERHRAGSRRPLGSPFTVGTNPISVVVGDFNGDGMQDLATANPERQRNGAAGERHGRVHRGHGQPVRGGNDSRFRGGGGLQRGWHSGPCHGKQRQQQRNGAAGERSGGFTAATGSPFAVGTLLISVAVGDFNGDGIEDLAVANSSDGTVTVLLGARGRQHFADDYVRCAEQRDLGRLAVHDRRHVQFRSRSEFCFDHVRVCTVSALRSLLLAAAPARSSRARRATPRTRPRRRSCRVSWSIRSARPSPSGR